MEYGLIEFETTLRCLAELDANLIMEPDQTKLSGCIMLSTEKLKFGLMIEIKGTPLQIILWLLQTSTLLNKYILITFPKIIIFL